MSNSAKNDLSTQIPQNVIDRAVKAVDERTQPPQPAAPEPPSGADPEALPAAKEEEGLREKLKETQMQLEMSQKLARETMERLKETHDRLLRTAADLDNYKKRAAREREEVARFGIEGLLRDLLPVLDNFDRALEHAKTSHSFDDLLKGLDLTRKAFEDTLGKRGVKGFTSLGQAFDPAKHEALQQVESADVPPGTVVQELVRGYTLHDRLTRPAAVVVSRAPPPPEPPKKDEPESEPAAAPETKVPDGEPGGEAGS